MGNRDCGEAVEREVRRRARYVREQTGRVLPRREEFDSAVDEVGVGFAACIEQRKQRPACGLEPAVPCGEVSPSAVRVDGRPQQLEEPGAGQIGAEDDVMNR